MSKNINLLNEKIFQTLFKLSAPLMATAFVMIAYSLTDLVWVGRLGTKSVAAVGTCGMIIWFVDALMLMPRVGMSIRASQSYGAREIEKTKNIFRNGIQLAFLIGLVLSLLTLAFKNEIVSFFNLEKEVHELAISYLSVCAIGFSFNYLNPILSACYNSMGNSVTPFRLNVVGLVANIILDPLLIFGLGPIPAMGVKGAALATLIAKIIVFSLFVYFIIRERDLIYKSKIMKKPDLKEYGEIVKLGYPAFIQSGVHSVVGMVLNKYMARYGSMPIAVFSIGSLIESVSWMTTDGISSAIAAMVGQNFGAKKFDRVIETYKAGLKITISLGLFVTIIFFIFGKEIFSIFLPSDTTAIAYGAMYLIIIGVSQPFMTVEIGTTGVFNGIGKPQIPGFNAMVSNILRIPLSLILMPMVGVYGVWTAMSISSILKGILNYIFINRELGKL